MQKGENSAAGKISGKKDQAASHSKVAPKIKGDGDGVKKQEQEDATLSEHLLEIKAD